MRRRSVLWLVGILGLLLAAEVALVVAVSTSSGADSKVRDSVIATRKFFLGDVHSRGAFERVGSNVKDVASELVGVLSGADDGRRKGDNKFAQCISCHRDYASKQRFSTTYLDHSRHSEIGLTCAECHTDTAHPKPEVPREKACAECHKEVNQRNKCDTCHPPGALPHFYRAGFPREGAVRCDSCHKRDAFTVDGGGVALPVLDRSDTATCMNCHEQQKCDSCHGTHPADWIRRHGESVLGDGGTSCTECHELTTCTSACHTDRSVLQQIG